MEGGSLDPSCDLPIGNLGRELSKQSLDQGKKNAATRKQVGHEVKTGWKGAQRVLLIIKIISKKKKYYKIGQKKDKGGKDWTLGTEFKTVKLNF